MTTNSIIPPIDLAQDFFLINGDRSPGKCLVRGASDPRKWEKRQGYGWSGAFLVYTGDDLPDFEIDVTLFTADDLTAWDTFFDKYLKKPPIKATPNTSFTVTAKPKALGVYHPKLIRLGISSAVVQNVTQFNQDDTGGETCTISFIKYRAPKPYLGKPDGSIPGVAKAKPTARDQFDVELEQKQAEAASLSNQNEALGSLF